MILSVLDYPEEPSDDAVAEATASLRYDDLVEDGRLRLESAWRPTGRALWGDPYVARVLGSTGRGVTTVLSRVSLQANDVSLTPRAPTTTRVRYRFLHTLNEAGQIDRLLFSTWLTVIAEDREGIQQTVARAYGQRVFTRLHAALGQHLVTSIAGFGQSGIPEHRGVWEPATRLLDLPPGAELLDSGPRLCPGRVVFGLSHTDMNQHVNFLMYHRAVEQAALARFVDLGMSAKIVSRESELGYRKPSFAGEVVRIALQAFRVEAALGVVAAVVDDDGGPSERATFRDFGSPRVVARMILRV